MSQPLDAQRLAAAAAATPRKSEIVALTSLRGVAAVAVVMQHFSVTAQAHASVTIPSLVPHGYLAVDLFFSLSGFIMSYTYLESFRRAGAAGLPRSFASFLGKRVARIMPLNVFTVLLIVLAGYVSVQVLGRNIIYVARDLPFDVLANVLMLQGLGIGANLNGPSWSVSTEFAAYLVFPVLVFAVLRSPRAVCIAALVASGVFVVGLALQSSRLSLDTGSVATSVLRCFAEFTLGMGAYRLFTHTAWAPVLRRDAVAVALIGGCAAFMLLRLDLPAVLLFPLLIAALALNEGKIARLMALPVLRFLGVTSFSIYMIHQLFRPVELELLVALHPAKLGMAAALACALLGSLTVIPFAWLTYRYVERPGRGVIRALFDRRAGLPAE